MVTVILMPTGDLMEISPNASQLSAEEQESDFSMTIVTNIRHFLDENDEIPELPLEAQELLSFLGEVVEAASLYCGFNRWAQHANLLGQ